MFMQKRDFISDSDEDGSGSLEYDFPPAPEQKHTTHNEDEFSIQPQYGRPATPPDHQMQFMPPAMPPPQQAPVEEFKFAPAQPAVEPFSQPEDDVTYSFKPMKKQENEKISFLPMEESRPTTQSTRPGSASAAMRAKMFEQQKNSLMKQSNNPFQVTSNQNYKGIGTIAAQSLAKPTDTDSIESMIYSNTIYNGPDIAGTREGRAFSNNIGGYEPQIGKTGEKGNLPAPVKADRTKFSSMDEVETLDLGEAEETRNAPSKTLLDMQKRQQMEEIPSNYNEAPTEQPPVQVESPKKEKKQRSQPQPTQQEMPAGPPPPAREQPPPQEIQQEQPPPNIPRNPPAPQINVEQILAQEMTDMRRFLTRPVPRGVMLQCTIKRDKSGFNRLYPKYFLHLSTGNQAFLLAGKKRPKNKTSNYLISMSQKDLNVKSSNFVGKLRSNFLGTEFNVYSPGLNPKKRAANVTNTREQMGVVLYQSNILGSKGPRKMRVLLPAVNPQGEHVIWKPRNKNDGMLQKYKAGDTTGMFVFYNKPPKWNEHVQAFVLNFNGRVDKASVKNFQLIDDHDENKVYLQFGRVGSHNFNIDFQWPISPLQAFAISLSSFDYKFACE